MGTLSSLWDNTVDSIFGLGSGIVNRNMAHPTDDYRVEHEPCKQPTGGGKKSAPKRLGKATQKTKTEQSLAEERKRTRRSTKKRRTNSTLKEQLKDMLLDTAKSMGKKRHEGPKPR